MLDVIHFLFEEDLDYSTAEQATYRSSYRQKIYKELYQGEYSYSVASEKDGYNYDNGSGLPSDGYYGEDEDIKPFDPEREPLKPFIPPTEFDSDSGLPLNSTILEAPLN
jgi:hypothetical protein